MTVPSDAMPPLGLQTVSPTASNTSRPVAAPLDSRQSENRAESDDDTLLKYFRNTLSTLVSIKDDSSPNAFEAFSHLAELPAPQENATRALYLAIIAWAARHAVNKGQLRFEIRSERLAEEAASLIKLGLSDEGGSAMDENMTMFAATLMLMQFKVGACAVSLPADPDEQICRGDVSGYQWIVKSLGKMCAELFPADGTDMTGDSKRFHL